MSESVEEAVRPRRRTQGERRAETRARVLTAARSVFLRRGVHGASLEEVAEEAGVSRGAVYYNFADKERLFLALLRDNCLKRAELFQRIASLPSEDGTNLRRAAAAFLDESDAGWTRLFVEFTGLAAGRPQLRAELAEELKACREAVARIIEQRLHEAGPEPDAVLDLVTTGVVALANGFAIEQAADSSLPPERFLQVIELIVAGLRTVDTDQDRSGKGDHQ